MTRLEIRRRAIVALFALTAITDVASAQRNPHATPTQRPAPNSAPAAQASPGSAAVPRPKWTPEQLAEAETRSAIDERNRARLHPGDPLELVGVFSGDNDGRAATPILKNGDGRPARVDPDEMRERALAMYADRSVLLQTPPASQQTDHPVAAPRPKGREAPGSPVETPESTPVAVWPWVVVAAGLLTAWFLARSRPAVRRPVGSDADALTSSARGSGPREQAPFTLVGESNDVVHVSSSKKTAA